MSYHFTALGTSAAVPTKTRGCSSYYLQMDSERILIDCGEGAQTQIIKHVSHGFKMNKVFITHAHPDHVLGLPGLIFSLNLNGRTKPLDVYGPETLHPWLLQQISFFEIDLNFEIRYNTHDFQTPQKLWTTQSLEFWAIPLDHTIPCCGFLAIKSEGVRKIKKSTIQSLNLSVSQIKQLKAGLDATGEDGVVYEATALTYKKPAEKILAFISDSRPLDNNLELLKEVHYIFHESTFLDADSHRAEFTGHSTAREAGQFAQHIQAKNLLLGHFSPRYPHPNLFISEASPYCSNVLAMQDGQRIDLKI